MDTYQRACAFSLNLTGVKIPSPLPEEHTLLVVAKWGNHTMKTVPSRKADELQPSIQERNTSASPQDQKLGLWIGIRPESSSMLTRKKNAYDHDDEALASEIAASKVPKGKSVNSLGSEEKVPLWEEKSGFSRIVVKFEVPERNIIYYELRGRDANTGLAVAYPVPMDEIFFFSAYRDDTATSFEKRRVGAVQAIKNYISSKINKDLSTGGFRPARSTAKLELSPNAALLLDMRGMCNEYAVTGAPYLLDEIEKCVKTMASALSGLERQQAADLYALLDVKQPLPDATLDSLVKFFKVTYPDLASSGHATQVTIKSFSDFIRKENLLVPYSKLRGIFGMFISCTRRGINDTSEISNWIKDESTLLFGPTQTPPKFDDISTDLKLWHALHTDKVEKILHHHENGLQALVDLHGSATTADNLWQLADRLAQRSDIDVADDCVVQAARFLARHMASNMDNTAKNLKMYLRELKKQKEMIAEDGQKKEEEHGA